MTSLNIVKVGGAVLENKESFETFLEKFIALESPKILVHGGGRTATALASRLGVETVMIAGRRVTDSDTLDIVTMVYGGLINKKTVAALQSAGVNAIGLTGADLGVVRSCRRPVTDGIDYGFVGDVESVNTDALIMLLDKCIVPVVSPITLDTHGQLLNTNADTMASEIAMALSDRFNVTLTFCFENVGVMAKLDDPESVIAKITHSDFAVMTKNGTVSGGMVPKVQNALKAVENGVKMVRITKFDRLESGTVITHN